VEVNLPHRITGIGVEHMPQPIVPSSSSRLTGTGIIDTLEPWLQRLGDADVFSGAVGLAKDGEILFARAYGEANKDFAVPISRQRLRRRGAVELWTGKRASRRKAAGTGSYRHPTYHRCLMVTIRQFGIADGSVLATIYAHTNVQRLEDWSMDWQQKLLTTSTQVANLLENVQRVAVLGMRTERYPYKPAFYVPAALLEMGLEIVPVSIHDRTVTRILGQPVYYSLADIPGPIDLVDVFRRAGDIPAHLDDILAKRPGAVWFQSGIRNDTVADQLARAGITVVQDRCLMMDYSRLSLHR
jgi:predicted CoA-binding protein